MKRREVIRAGGKGCAPHGGWLLHANMGMPTLHHRREHTDHASICVHLRSSAVKVKERMPPGAAGANLARHALQAQSGFAGVNLINIHASATFALHPLSTFFRP